MPDDVLAVVAESPLSIAAVGLALVVAADLDPGADGVPVGQRLAAAGLSLSALQQLVDRMVADRLLTEVRGKDLWDRGLPTAGTKATGRYYLRPLDGAQVDAPPSTDAES